MCVQWPTSFAQPFADLGTQNVTLAESSNSPLKQRMHLCLLEAAWDDTTTMVIKEEEMKAFLAQVAD